MNLTQLPKIKIRWNSYDLDSQIVMAASFGSIIIIFLETINCLYLSIDAFVYHVLAIASVVLCYSFYLAYTRQNITQASWIYFVTY